MSFTAVAWAKSQRTGSTTNKAVLITLAECADHTGANCYPSHKYIAYVCECSERTVERAIQQLAALKLLDRVRRRRQDGKYGGYSYKLPIEQAQLALGEPTEYPPDNLSSGQIDQWTNTTPATRHSRHQPPDTVSGPEPGEEPSIEPGEGARAREAVDNFRRTIIWRKYQIDISAGPAGLSESLVIEWLDERRAERRPCNQSTVTLWMRELARAVDEKGWEADQALTFAMGWQNFSADWLDRYSDTGARKPEEATAGIDEAWGRLVQHCRRGHTIAEVRQESPDLEQAARDLGGMSHLRNLTEREMEFQRRKFQSLYQQATASKAAAGRS